MTALYPRLLGHAWSNVAESVRHAHHGGSLTGTFRVQHGPSRLGRLLLRVIRMPRPAESADVRVTVSPIENGERWFRTFDGRPLVTVQHYGRTGLLLEQIGLLEFQYRLRTRDGALEYEQVGVALCAGPGRLPLPSPVAPLVEARETPAGSSGIHVRVKISVPVLGDLISYEGVIRTEESPAQALRP